EFRRVLFRSFIASDAAKATAARQLRFFSGLFSNIRVRLIFELKIPRLLPPGAGIPGTKKKISSIFRSSSDRGRGVLFFVSCDIRLEETQRALGQTDTGEPAAPSPHVDGPGMDSQTFGDLFNGQPFMSKSLLEFRR